MEKDNIKVGEYIRTKKGNICKVLATREKSSFITSSGYNSTSPERYFVDNTKQYSISKPYVAKHSKELRDLIEIGDIVIVQNGLGEEELIFTDNEDKKHIVRTHKIKSIVTKEQYKEMEYRV